MPGKRRLWRDSRRFAALPHPVQSKPIAPARAGAYKEASFACFAMLRSRCKGICHDDERIHSEHTSITCNVICTGVVACLHCACAGRLWRRRRRGRSALRSATGHTNCPGFTPTVANDALIVVNPPAVPVLGAPVTFTDPAINKHLSLTNAAGALGAGLKGQGVTIGFVDTGINRNHPALSGRVGASFIHIDPIPITPAWMM